MAGIPIVPPPTTQSVPQTSVTTGGGGGGGSSYGYSTNSAGIAFNAAPVGTSNIENLMIPNISRVLQMSLATLSDTT